MQRVNTFLLTIISATGIETRQFTSLISKTTGQLVKVNVQGLNKCFSPLLYYSSLLLLFYIKHIKNIFKKDVYF